MISPVLVRCRQPKVGMSLHFNRSAWTPRVARKLIWGSSEIENNFSQICKMVLDNFALITPCRRKFRSQTSDKMDRWKAEVVRVRVKEEKRREEKRREEKRREEKRREEKRREEKRREEKRREEKRREEKRREEKRREEKRREEKRREEKRREKRRRKKIKKIKSQKKEDPGARKGGKVAKPCVFPMTCGSGGRKVGWLKRRARCPLARWEMKNCTPLQREARLQVKKLKAPHVWSTFSRERLSAGFFQ